MSRNGSRDDFAAIPILLELVPEHPEPEAAAPASPAVAAAARRRQAVGAEAVRGRDAPQGREAPQGRDAQRSLFDDADTNPPPRSVARRAKPSPSLQRLAEEMLRAKAPAIINALVEEQAQRLAVELRERLRAELARLMAELAEQDPGTSADVSLTAPRPSAPAATGNDEYPGN